MPGLPRGSVPAWWRCRITWAAGAERGAGAGVDRGETGRGRGTMRRREGVAPFRSKDPDSSRIWWRDAGVHQNLIFPVHPDPISGQHAWHQRVLVRPAQKGDREGDISVDTRASRRLYREWLAPAPPAS